jgi:putative ABC transport system permease protein
MYIPYGQVPNVEARPIIVLRTSVDAWSLAASLRRAIASIDRDVLVDQITTVRELISNSAGQPRFRTAVILTFSLLALFVASLGLYGVMNYLVTQRMQEFGVRMALGATRSDVMRLIFGQASKMVGVGIALGLGGSALISRAVMTLLYRVAPFDAGILASVSSLLASVAFLAVYFPARRAGKCDPMESLRHD